MRRNPAGENELNTERSLGADSRRRPCDELLLRGRLRSADGKLSGWLGNLYIRYSLTWLTSIVQQAPHDGMPLLIIAGTAFFPVGIVHGIDGIGVWFGGW
jgi:hypothetical protein